MRRRMLVAALLLAAFLPAGVRADADSQRESMTELQEKVTSFQEACGWLKPKERLAVLSDRALISLLARLPPNTDAAV